MGFLSINLNGILHLPSLSYCHFFYEFSANKFINAFCSNALNRIFYPVWNELPKDFKLPEYAQFLDERKIEGLQNLLSYKSHSAIPLKNYVEKLCGELELFLSWIDEHLTLLQKQVHYFFSFIILTQGNEIRGSISL